MKSSKFTTIYIAGAALLSTLPCLASGAFYSNDLNEFAMKTTDPSALTISEIKTERISESFAAKLCAARTFEDQLINGSIDATGAKMADSDGVEVVFDKIINLGQKVWDLVAKGKPVVNVDMQAATAMPQGITSWDMMEGWEAPKTALYRMSAKNLYGVTVVDFTYRVLYISGGSYKGKGKYLARVAVQPVNLSVAWGYNFEATAEVPSVLNAGTVAAPVGAAEVFVKWKMSTVVKENQGSGSYYVTGDGQFRNSDNN